MINGRAGAPRVNALGLCLMSTSRASERTAMPTAAGNNAARGAPTGGGGMPVPWEYAPAPESREIVQLQARYGLFIGGREVAPKSGKWFTDIDPSTEEPLAEIARANVEDVDAAVGAARQGQRRSGGRLPGRGRAKYLFRIARI